MIYKAQTPTVLAMQRRLAEILIEKSYREGDFVLASGKRSDWYFDCRVAALSCEGALMIGELFNAMLGNDDIRGVGGMSLGADPLVTATSLISRSRKGNRLDGLLVRKEPKGHGVGGYVVGIENFREGDRVAVLEDVVTTGGSLLKACRRIEDCGLMVVKACAILDRGDGGTEAIEAAGYAFQAIFDRSSLLKMGRGRNHE